MKTSSTKRRYSGYFSIEAALSSLLLLALFQSAAYAAYVHGASEQSAASRQASLATLVHISDYLVKYGAACGCHASDSCALHHCLDRNALAPAKAEYENNPEKYGFSHLEISDAPPAPLHENQLCTYRTYDDSGRPVRLFVCGW